MEPKGTNKRGKYAALKQFELHYEAEHKDLPLCINFRLKGLRRKNKSVLRLRRKNKSVLLYCNAMTFSNQVRARW